VVSTAPFLLFLFRPCHTKNNRSELYLVGNFPVSVAQPAMATARQANAPYNLTDIKEQEREEG